MMNHRQFRRAFRATPDGNLLIRRVEGRPPLKLLLDSICPECKVTLGPHGENKNPCRFFEKMTLDELAKAGYAEWVEQL